MKNLSKIQKSTIWLIVLARLSFPSLIIPYPIFGIIGSIFLDIIDHTILLIVGLEVHKQKGNSIYQIYDKLLDQYYYIFILIHFFTNYSVVIKTTALVLFTFRLIGLFIYAVTRKDIIPVIFQNFFENFALLFLFFNPILEFSNYTKAIFFTITSILTKIPHEVFLYRKHVNLTRGPAVKIANWFRCKLDLQPLN